MKLAKLLTAAVPLALAVAVAAQPKPDWPPSHKKEKIGDWTVDTWTYAGMDVRVIAVVTLDGEHLHVTNGGCDDGRVIWSRIRMDDIAHLEGSRAILMWRRAYDEMKVPGTQEVASRVAKACGFEVARLGTEDQ